jgi:hypothetical protein
LSLSPPCKGLNVLSMIDRPSAAQEALFQYYAQLDRSGHGTRSGSKGAGSVSYKGTAKTVADATVRLSHLAHDPSTSYLHTGHQNAARGRSHKTLDKLSQQSDRSAVVADDRLSSYLSFNETKVRPSCLVCPPGFMPNRFDLIGALWRAVGFYSQYF